MEGTLGTLAYHLGRDRQGILQEAAEIISGSRREAYGDIHESFQRIAQLWTAILGSPITPNQVCLMMIALKLARETNKHKRDNLVDICGYTAILEEIATKKNP